MWVSTLAASRPPSRAPLRQPGRSARLRLPGLWLCSGVRCRDTNVFLRRQPPRPKELTGHLAQEMERELGGEYLLTAGAGDQPQHIFLKCHKCVCGHV